MPPASYTPTRILVSAPAWTPVWWRRRRCTPSPVAPASCLPKNVGWAHRFLCRLRRKEPLADSKKCRLPGEGDVFGSTQRPLTGKGDDLGSLKRPLTRKDVCGGSPRRALPREEGLKCNARRPLSGEGDVFGSTRGPLTGKDDDFGSLKRPLTREGDTLESSAEALPGEVALFICLYFRCFPGANPRTRTDPARFGDSTLTQEPVIVELTPHDSELTLTGLPSGKSVIGSVAGVNAAGEGPCAVSPALCVP